MLPDNYKKRQALRRKLHIPVVVITDSGGQRIAQAETLDVSNSGAKLKIDPSIELPEQFLITLSESGEVQRLCRLVWRTDAEIGVRFVARAPASRVRRGAAGQ
mgnify:CR=1 FL=1